MSKREHKRHNIDHHAVIILNNGIRANCRIQNFSFGGLFLIEANNSDNIMLNIPSGANAEIQIETQNKTLTAQTKTVHSSSDGLGVAFTHKETELLNHLRRMASRENAQRFTGSTTQTQNKLDSDKNAIVDWIHSTTNSFLESRYQEFIESSCNALFDAANTADSNKAQSLLFNAYNALKSHNENVKRKFLENVRLSFNDYCSRRHLQDEQEDAPQQTEEEMELVAKEDFEEWVSVVSLTRSLDLEVTSKLNQLQNSLSYLAKTYINNDTNPVSPYSLLWSFNKSFSNLDIALEAKKIIFSVFQHNMFNDIGSLYDEINHYLNQQGIAKLTQDLKTDRQQKSTPTRVNKKLTDNLSSLIGFIGKKSSSTAKGPDSDETASRENAISTLANISPAGRRPIIQKIDERLSQDSISGHSLGINNEIRNTIQFSEQLLGSLQQDTFISPEIQSLIDSLKIPFVKEAINNPELFNDANHPGHKLLDTIGKLGPYLSNIDQDRSGKGFVYKTIEEVNRLTEQGAQLDINEVTSHLEKIIDHQKDKVQSNIGIVTQSCEQDEKYLDAKKYVFKFLCSKLTHGTIPMVVEQLLYLGWIGLLVHTISTFGKTNDKTIRLAGVIDLFLDIFTAEQGVKPITDSQKNYLIKVIKSGFSKYPLYADDANQYLIRLEAILETGGIEHATIANKRVLMEKAHIKQLLDEQTKRLPNEAPKSNIEKSWLNLVHGIKLEDWIIEQRRLGRARMLNLAWKNPDSSRYVFVDGEGNKQLDTESHELATMFKQRHCSLLEDGNLPIVERAVNRLLKNTFEQIKHESDTDDLTGLQRRRTFQREISELIEVTNDIGDHHILLELDIDQFSMINNICGHKGGDKLLQTFSNILSNYAPENATLARIGEDEFGILIKNCSLDEGYHIAETQRGALENLRYTWDGTTIPATASIGIAQIDVGTRSAAEVMNMAYSACRSAIQDGGNCIKIYRPTDEDIEKQGRMAKAVPIIEDTLKNNKLSLFAQPITSIFIGDEDEHHYEILLRINNDKGSWDNPNDFIHAAEKCNRMRSVDRWVINQIFAWLENHHQEINNTGISINLSAQTLEDDSFLAFINDHLDTSPFPCNKIVFEITETSLVKHIDKARTLVEEIKRKGCKFSLDDFGTGYSSYSYLKDFPVDHVKIDGIFIKDMLEDSSSHAMVKSITEISHHMGKKVVAEYVESEAILVALRELEVDFAQGYYLGQPAPIKSLLQTTL